MRQVSVSVLRQRVRRSLDALQQSHVDPAEFCKFFYFPPGDCQEIEISEEDFFKEDAPPGLYRFLMQNERGEVECQEDGIKYELRLGARDVPPDPSRDLSRSASIMLSSSASEVERIARRQREADQEVDRHRSTKRSLEDALDASERTAAQLRAELEDALSQDDFGELASVLGEIAIRVLDLDKDDAPEATVKDAWEVILVAIRKSKDAQRALSAAGAGQALLALGLGDDPSTTGETA